MKKRIALIAVMAVIFFLGCPKSEVATIDVTPATGTTGIGLTAQFTATAHDADGNVVDDVDFTWTSSSTATATVDTNGLATGVAAGSCTITAASGDIEGAAALVVTSGPTHHGGDIDADETWYPSANPHIIDDDINVQNNATLTIMPGCIVKVQPSTEIYAGYYGAGSIIADGKADTTILFTSNVASPSPGDWIGIGLYQYAMNTSSFSYCTIEYAGSNVYHGSFWVEGVTFAKFNHNTLRQSSSDGVCLYSDAGFQSFANNTVTGCNGYPLHLNAEFVRTIGAVNTFTSNTTNAVYVTSGTVHTSGTWVNNGVPYVLGGDVNIGDNNTSPVITIAPGNIIKFQPDIEFYTGYYAAGGLIADGSTGRIIFTSNVASPSPGDYYHVGFYQYSIGASCKLINCNVLYGGGFSTNDGNVVIEDALPDVRGDSIGYSATWGIYIYGNHPDRDSLLAHNTFFSNDSGPVSP
jgi:hypothetical protein